MKLESLYTTVRKKYRGDPDDSNLALLLLDGHLQSICFPGIGFESILEFYESPPSLVHAGGKIRNVVVRLYRKGDHFPGRNPSTD